MRAAGVVGILHVLIPWCHALLILDLRCQELSACRHAEVPAALPVARGNASAAARKAQKLHLSSVLHQVLGHSGHGYFCTVEGLHHASRAASGAQGVAVDPAHVQALARAVIVAGGGWGAGGHAFLYVWPVGG